jgi:cytochrome c oxidase subunit II
LNIPLVPQQASEFATRYDILFGIITALTIFFTVVVLALLIFFAVRYRVGSKVNRERPVHENLKLEIAWSLPPLFLGIGIFAIGAHEWIEFRTPPDDATEIFVIGKQWMWHVYHPNGVRENNELHVPLGRPVKLTMISQDVIHSFFIPEFRAQYQVIPGRYTSMWFTPTKTGRFYLFCGLYCGTDHSQMGGYVYVLPETEYAQWLAAGGERPAAPAASLAEEGRRIFAELNCGSCHGGQDTVFGPTLAGIAGTQRRMRTGEVLTADDDYLRNAIVNPSMHLVQGYENTMPQDYDRQLQEWQIRALIEHIKTLGAAEDRTNASPGAPGQRRPEGEPAPPRVQLDNRSGFDLADHGAGNR